MGKYGVEKKPLGHSTGYFYYLVCDDKQLCGFKYEDDADFICDLLNKQDDIIEKYRDILNAIGKCVKYSIDNERSYGDEYTASVLNDIFDEFILGEFMK